MSLSEDDLGRLLKTFLHAYRERVNELEPNLGEAAPLLVDPRIDVVLVNGGRALHFVFSDDEGVLTTIVRLHDMTHWPPTTAELKEQEDVDAHAHKDRVRRTARIEGKVLAHFVLYPEDGGMDTAMFHTGSRLAEEDIKNARTGKGPDASE
ncbi:MAG: hypothetical protein KY455_07205 [Euryarchaeota archaeon]|nr:hypothetical protein [Euryarchaeota archaeon]